MKNFPLLTAASACALIALGSANASADIEELVVTGELRETGELSIANSVSLISANEIKKRNAQQLEDLLNLAPNVNFSAGASRGRFLQIRGIGELAEFTAPLNSSVGVIVDGIDFTGISGGVTAVDAQQVEIFRGPQGTLYGANALAGLINVEGKGVGDQLEAEVGGSFGNFGRRDFNAAVGTPFSDSVGWRLAVKQSTSNGFIDNEFLDTDDTNNIDEFSLRNLFSFTLSDTASLDLITHFIDIDNGYDAFSLDQNQVTLSDEPGQDGQETVANALHFDYTGWNFADVNAVVSHAQSDLVYSFDLDWSFRELCAIDEPCFGFQYSQDDEFLRDNDNTTADVRLLSKSGNLFDWVVGLYHRSQDIELDFTNTENDPTSVTFFEPLTEDLQVFTTYQSDFETENTAIYAQVGYQLNDNLRLSGGARLERYNADFVDSNQFSASPDENLFGGKISLEYQANDNTLVYGLISRGYKVGGFNAEESLSDEQQSFDTETQINYEIGTKGQWLDGRLQAQVAAFYQDRNDIQVTQSFAAAVDSFVLFTANAAEGTNVGLEAEIAWQALDQLQFFATLGLLQTEFDDFVNTSHVDAITDATTGEITGVDLSGRDQAHAPNYQFFTGANWAASDKLSFQLEFEGKDEFFFSDSNEARSESYVLTNLRAEYQLDNIVLAIWGKNLTDELVETRGFFFSNLFGNDPRGCDGALPFGGPDCFPPEVFTQQGAPRTFGVSAAYNF